MITMTNCTECNKPGGTIPKYHESGPYLEEVKELMHPECALASMVRYMNRKEQEASAHTG